MNGSREGLDAKPMFHGQRNLSDHFAGARRNDRRPDDSTIPARDELHEPGFLRIADRAICLREGCMMHREGAAQSLASLSLRPSNARDFGIGEGDRGQHVGSRRGLARKESVSHGSKALPSGEVRELWSTKDIPTCEDVLNVGSQVAVDRYPAIAISDACTLEFQPLNTRHASRGDE